MPKITRRIRTLSFGIFWHGLLPFFPEGPSLLDQNLSRIFFRQSVSALLGQERTISPSVRDRVGFPMLLRD